MHSFSSFSRTKHQQQWRTDCGNGSSSGGANANPMKKDKTLGFPNYPCRVQEADLSIEHNKKNNVYQMYCGKFRKSAVRSKPVIGLSNSNSNQVRNRRVLDEKPINMSNPNSHVHEMGTISLGLKCGDRYARQVFDEIPKRNGAEQSKKLVVSRKGYKENNNVGYYKGDDERVMMDEIETKRWLLEMFGKVYRKVEATKVPKQSIRTDMLAWKEMEKRYGGILEPVKQIGKVPGVEVGEVFDFRLELVIMGIHFQQMNGIDYLQMCPSKELRATSVVATEGYEDNMIESDVVMYTGEGGGTFEGSCSKSSGKKVIKDQVLKGGNLALKNSMIARTEVRVVRGVKGGKNNRPVFVYDGLYRVVDCKEIIGACGNKQFQFKLVRCPGQNQIAWAKYKLKN